MRLVSSRKVVRMNSPRKVDEASTDDHGKCRCVEQWIMFRLKRINGRSGERRVMSLMDRSSSSAAVLVCSAYGTVIDKVRLAMFIAKKESCVNDEFNVQLDRRINLSGVHIALVSARSTTTDTMSASRKILLDTMRSQYLFIDPPGRARAHGNPSGLEEIERRRQAFDNARH